MNKFSQFYIPIKMWVFFFRNTCIREIDDVKTWIISKFSKYICTRTKMSTKKSTPDVSTLSITDRLWTTSRWYDDVRICGMLFRSSCTSCPFGWSFGPRRTIRVFQFVMYMFDGFQVRLFLRPISDINVLLLRKS